MTDLRERVARAICGGTDDIGDGWRRFLPEADAAIELMVEECAKVAKDVRDRLRMDRAKKEPGGVQYAFLDAQQYVAREIEVKIRALAKEDKVWAKNRNRGTM